MTTANAAAPTTTYFWLATFQWPTPTGIGTATLHSTFNVTGPITRSKALTHIKQTAEHEGIPNNAFVMFLTIEPDQMGTPAI